MSSTKTVRVILRDTFILALCFLVVVVVVFFFWGGGGCIFGKAILSHLCLLDMGQL